jgi:hypothetical protein
MLDHTLSESTKDPFDQASLHHSIPSYAAFTWAPLFVLCEMFRDLPFARSVPDLLADLVYTRSVPDLLAHLVYKKSIHPYQHR